MTYRTQRTRAASLPTSLLAKSPEPAELRRLMVDQLEPSGAITPRQREVLHCLVEGKPTKTICAELLMSEGTAKAHIGAIFRTLRVRNRTQATLVALRDGWVQPELWSQS